MYSLQLGYLAADENIMHWEYYEKMRSWLQPAYGFLIAKAVFGFFGDRPLLADRAIYLCNFLLFLLALLYFIKWLKLKEFRYKDTRPLAFVSSLCLLYPYMHAYITVKSQESFCMYFLVAFFYSWQRAEAFLAKQGTERRLIYLTYFLCGLWTGLAFEARFQSAALLLGFLSVYFLDALMKKQRCKILPYLQCIAGGMTLLVCAAFLDRWGYGSWVFAPWNYFWVNLVEGMASEFSVDPLSFYIRNRIPVLLLFVFVIYKLRFLENLQYKALVCGISCFFVMHSSIEHKEYRFVIPLLVPYTYLLLQYAKQMSCTLDPVAMKIIAYKKGRLLILSLTLLFSIIQLMGHALKPWIHKNRLWHITTAGLPLLEELEPHSKVIARHTNYYTFHEFFSKSPLPTIQDNLSDENKGLFTKHGDRYIARDAMSDFFVPKTLYLIYALPQDYRKACQASPEAFLFEKQSYYAPQSSLASLQPFRSLAPNLAIRVIYQVYETYKSIEAYLMDAGTKSFGMKWKKRKYEKLKQFQLYKCQSLKD